MIEELKLVSYGIYNLNTKEIEFLNEEFDNRLKSKAKFMLDNEIKNNGLENLSRT